MKKVLLTLVLCFTAAFADAKSLYDEDGNKVTQKADYDWTVMSLFHENGRVFDFAIGSAIETGFDKDGRNGGWGYSVQTPLLFIANALSTDLGYLAPFDDSGRGSVTIGETLRLDRVFTMFYPEQSKVISGLFPDSVYVPHFVFGPHITYTFVGDDFRAGARVAISWRF